MSNGNTPGTTITPDEDAQTLITEANGNTQAMIDAITAIIRADTIDDTIRATLDTIRKQFGWIYASYWSVDTEDNILVFSSESGRVDDEFQRQSRTARFREGEGLNGRAWRQRDLVHVADLGELSDCSRAPLARRAGIKSAIALPIQRDGQVTGTVDFFTNQTLDISPTRLGAIRIIGQLASDKISKLARQGDLNRIKQMVDNAPINMMYADLDLKMRYMNPKAEQTLKRLEAYLPIKVHQMIGQSIDLFHKAPEHQRRILGDSRNLPRTTMIHVGPEIFELNINPMLDQNGKYIGPMIAWEVVTERLEIARREAETAADVKAVNQLLMALGRCRSTREVITAALASVREAFAWSYGSFWEVNSEDHALRFAHDSGSVSEEFRRITAEARFREGEGLNGQT